MAVFGPFSTTYQLSQLIPTYSSTIDLLRPRGKTKWKYTREEEKNKEEKERKRIPPGKGTEIGAMNYAYQESKHGYTCNIDRRNAALRIWSVYVARYRENIRNDATRQYATRLEPR